MGLPTIRKTRMSCGVFILTDIWRLGREKASVEKLLRRMKPGYIYLFSDADGFRHHPNNGEWLMFQIRKHRKRMGTVKRVVKGHTNLNSGNAISLYVWDYQPQNTLRDYVVLE